MSRRAFTEAPEFAIGLAVVGAFLLVGQDSTIKWLSSSMGIVQILFLRNLIAMGLLWSGAAATGQPIGSRLVPSVI